MTCPHTKQRKRASKTFRRSWSEPRWCGSLQPHQISARFRKFQDIVKEEKKVSRTFEIYCKQWKEEMVGR